MISNKIKNKIWLRENVVQLSKEIHKTGQKMVFTNGVFDILHAGHVSYLADASELGDFLIVGVNSDESVKRLGKSPSRPLQSEESRLAVLASLEWVNAVVVFSEDTPEELIKETLPDVLVKGGDYALDAIVGAETVLQNGGLVTTIELIPGYSTTSIENKIILENK